MTIPNEDEYKIPATPTMKEAVQDIADMCSVFYLRLIETGVPEEAAIAMAVEHTHVITCGASGSDPHGE